MEQMDHGPQALNGIRVLDVSTLFAGPFMATILGDYGAEVIKIEHPKGDPARGHGPSKNGVPLWWKMLGRNKRNITLYLGDPRGQEIFLKLAAEADLIIENFRPGTLERWGLGWERLRELNPGLILVRVTGFGQFGPYASRPGFGTLAECMSGFAHITGQPDGPPTLPPFGLADGISAISGAVAVLMALYHRDTNGGGGQVIDLAITDPMLSVLGPQVIVYDQLGVIQGRTGNRSVNNAPRNTYVTKDGRWVAISTSAQSIAERVMRLVGHPEVISEPWFASGKTRVEHADVLDEMVGGWIRSYDFEEVMRRFEEAEAAIAPVYDASQIVADPHFQARETITTVDDPELGRVKMQNMMFRMSGTPGRIAWAGRPKGADNGLIFKEWLGLTETDLEELRMKSVI